MPWRLVLVLLLCKTENALCLTPSWPCLRAHGKSLASACSTLKRARPTFTTFICKKDNNGRKVAANLKTSKGFATPAGPVKHQRTPSPEVMANETDDLNLYQLARMLADVRRHYRSTSEVPQEVVRRNLHCKRINNLHISRSRVAPSTINGAGQGLFATRDIEAGELITCYPGDAVLCWEDSDHSWARDIRVFHGSHVSSNEANAQRAVGHLRDYEVPASDTLSIVGDPLLCSDAAYLGHMANDGCSPDFASYPVRSSATDSSEGEGGGGGGGLGPQERYQGESALAVNAEHITVEGSHTITRALKGIRAGEEVFVTYGYDYWLSRRSRVESDNETGEIS